MTANKSYPAKPGEGSLFESRPLTPEDARKIDAYDAARATVKIEGNTRAYYVLRAEAAEARLAAAQQALRAYFAERDGEVGTFAPTDETEALMRAALGGSSG